MRGYNTLLNSIKINRHEGFLLPESVLDMIATIVGEMPGRTLIPNENYGELSLGQSDPTAFTTIEPGKNFLNADIHEQFEKIIMFSPIGWQKGEQPYRPEIMYFDKALSLLKTDGIFVAVVAQNFLSAPLFKPVRERILTHYSLDAVIDVGAIIRPFSNFPFSILVVKNKNQTKNVFLSSLLNNPHAVHQYITNTGDCWHPFEEIIDRFDVGYYDKKYTEIRHAIHNRDTVHLGDIAEVYPGITINARERLAEGKYIIIKPQHIFDGVVHLGNNRVSYCSQEYFESIRDGERAVLRPGDIVISLLGNINWARYTGEHGVAVANQNTAIIRPRKTTQHMFDLFFSSDVGIKYLENQLKYFSHYGVYHHISIRDLKGMAVPDIQTMQKAARIASLHEYEAKVSAAFASVGWEVEENYRVDRFCFDLALKINGEIQAIVELKQYTAESIQKDTQIRTQFERYHSAVPNVELYFFVDERIFCYKSNRFIELNGLPRPNEVIFDDSISYAETETQEAEISLIHSDAADTAISDSVLLEAMNGGFERLTDIVNQLLSGQVRIESKIDDIAKQIEELSRQITSYQSLVSRQLEMVASEAEEDRIIHAFSEECTERIILEMQKKSSSDTFHVEQQKLENSFGESAWSKLADQSRTFLVSAKVIFNSLVTLQDSVDYSGVCLLVTKALELELSRRFCKDFVSFLKQRYRKDYSLYPTALLDKYGKPIKPKHFTLGSVAYVLCYEKSDDVGDEAFENNRQKLLEFCKEKLLPTMDDATVFARLNDFASQVETVKTEYRNPAAHTNELKYVKAQECFDLIVDVEKLLKKMLDAFSY